MMHELPLNRLSPLEITELSTSMLGKVGNNPEVLALLHRETEGNAFFLVEVVRALAEEAGRLNAIGQMPLPQQLFPQGIQTIVQRRLARVPQDGVPLLVGTAVAGRQIDLKLLSLLAGETKTEIPVETWLATCGEAAVLELFNGNWRFAHDKLRTGILESITAVEKKGWHGTVARLIEQAHPSDPDQAAALVYHWHEAENVEKERHFALVAGTHAQKQFLPETALNFFDRALNLTDPDKLPDLFELHLAREQAYHFLGRRDEQKAALATLSKIAAQLAEQHNSERRAEVALRMANYAEATGDYPAAIAAANQALQAALASSDRQSETASYLASGRALLRQGKHEEARQILENSLSAARAHGFTELEADSLRQLGVLTYDTGQLEKATAYYGQSLPLYEKLENKQGESTVYNNLSVVAFSQGNIEQALNSLEKAQQIDEAIGDREGRARILTNLSSLYLDLGAYTIAEKYATEGLNLCREIDVPFGECLNMINLSLTAYFLEDNARADTLSQEVLALTNKIGSQFLRGLALKDRGFLLLNQEKFAEATAVYQASVECLVQTDQVLESHAGLAWLALKREDETAVRHHLEPILTHLQTGQTLDGTSRPFYILLMTYKALAALNDPQAAEILALAYRRLVHWANQITDDDRRDSFLESVPVNLEISLLYENDPNPT